MGIGVAALTIGLVTYFGRSAVGASMSGPDPKPGTGDVAPWMSGVALAVRLGVPVLVVLDA